MMLLFAKFLEMLKGDDLSKYPGKKVKASHARYRTLVPELIPVYRQSACM